MTVEKADLEAKLREIEGVATDIEEDVTRNATSAIVLAGAIAVGLVIFVIWRSRRSKIHVEVYTK